MTQTKTFMQRLEGRNIDSTYFEEDNCGNKGHFVYINARDVNQARADTLKACLEDLNRDMEDDNPKKELRKKDRCFDAYCEGYEKAVRDCEEIIKKHFGGKE